MTTTMPAAPRRIAGFRPAALSVLLTTTAFVSPNLAFAQAQTAQVDVEEITVTGTRVIRDGYEAPTPTTVMGLVEIQAAAPANIADFVNTLPALAGSATPSTGQSSVSAGGAGLNVLNLRNLGSARTLVLLDGQRVVGSQPTGQVDINDFPQELVSRVDIVTGGASAAYGSDAFSGVVNFIIDRTFTGLKGEVSGGVTTYGDDANYKASLTGGSAFANDRGHFILSGEASYNKGILLNTRPWNQLGWKQINNPAYGTGAGQSTSVPERLVLPQVAQNVITPGGIIVAGPLKGTAFGEGGVPYQFNYGPIVLDPWMQGGEWKANDISHFTTLQPRQSRQSAFARASYDVTDNVEVFVQWSWGFSRVDQSQTSPKYNQGNLTIPADNAFIPAEVRARMTTLGLTNFRFGTMNLDLAPSATDNERIVSRYIAGANGTFDAVGGEWNWDAYYQYGYTRVAKRFVDRITNHFNRAIDAVRHPTSNVIVCRVNADASTANDDPNCVPFNLFGYPVNNQAVHNYIIGTSYNRQHYIQEVMAANLSGEPFSSWAGPVSLAVGAEHRREDGGGFADALSMANGYTLGNQLATFGQYTVNEAYIETVVPLAVNQAWAQNLDLNGAVRFTDYSTSGYVTTWKLGLVYQVTDEVRLRATRSRDIRAPNRQELFATGVFTTNTLIDPFRGNQATTYTTNTSGNPDLKPEIGDTTGVGAVYQPSWLPGFSVSADYYDIKIKDAIGNLGPQQIVDQCFTGNQTFCDAITRSGNIITEIKSSPFNFVNQQSRGLDLEASYRFALGDLIESWSGDVVVRGLATRFLENYTSNGVNIPTDTVGQNAGSGPPKWRYTAQVTYGLDPIRFALIARGVSAGVYDNTFVECQSGCPVSTVNNRTINTNRIGGALWLDTNIAYAFMTAEDNGADVEAFLSIKNILNKDPPVVAPGPGGVSFVGAAYNSSLYDGLGRVFRIGLRFER
jgi:outer membrane receptor protein involved in Fe transport